MTRRVETVGRGTTLEEASQPSDRLKFLAEQLLFQLDNLYLSMGYTHSLRSTN